MTGSGNTVLIVLLKTRSHPHDAYEEFFSTPHPASESSTLSPPFEPVFIPVLEHKRDDTALGLLGELLQNDRLKERYGGMIFTSQRAVEGWMDTVKQVEQDLSTGRDVQPVVCSEDQVVSGANLFMNNDNHSAVDARSNNHFTTDVSASTPFPFYTVGPATARSLMTLLSSSADCPNSPLTRLNPEISGAHTGNGAALAQYMLRHYNRLHAERWFIYYEAPRLPFIPLLGMGSENYSRKRLEAKDPRLQKKPLVFLVGEQRRDIIPKTLTNEDLNEDRIEVEEVEVYSTVVMESFKIMFDTLVSTYREEPEKVIVIVVFSPQGSKDMLQSLGFINQQGRATEKGKNRRNGHAVKEEAPRYVIVTIGPTTRDHLRDHFGFEPDVCATKPSPEGIAEALLPFLEHEALAS